MPVKNVYCWQSGDGNCYKVGLTKNEPKVRKRGFSTGSPVKFKDEPYRTIRSEHAHALEKYIHKLLDARRAENGEYFNVTVAEFDEAADKAIAVVEESRPAVLGR